MAESLLNEFESSLDSLELIPSSGGVFEVTVGGELAYSKKATGRHAETAEVVNAIRKLLP